MDNRAYDTHPQSTEESSSIGADGELLDAVFCLHCGCMNDLEAILCKECGDPLIEQGTELRSRLGRIRRYARGEDLGALSGLTAQEFRASIRQLLTPTKQSREVNPKHQEIMTRVAQTARTIHDPQFRFQSPDFLEMLFIMMVAPILYTVFPIDQNTSYRSASAPDQMPSFHRKSSPTIWAVLLLIAIATVIVVVIFLMRMVQIPLGLER